MFFELISGMLRPASVCSRNHADKRGVCFLSSALRAAVAVIVNGPPQRSHSIVTRSSPSQCSPGWCENLQTGHWISGLSLIVTSARPNDNFYLIGSEGNVAFLHKMRHKNSIVWFPISTTPSQKVNLVGEVIADNPYQKMSYLSNR